MILFRPENYLERTDYRLAIPISVRHSQHVLCCYGMLRWIQSVKSVGYTSDGRHVILQSGAVGDYVDPIC